MSVDSTSGDEVKNPKPAPDPRRQQGGRLGGFRKASRYGPEELTGAARRAFLAKFEDQVDPDRILAPEERARRAEAARRAHMIEMSLKSARARKLRAEADELERDLGAPS